MLINFNLSEPEQNNLQKNHTFLLLKVKPQIYSQIIENGKYIYWMATIISLARAREIKEDWMMQNEI